MMSSVQHFNCPPLLRTPFHLISFLINSLHFFTRVLQSLWFTASRRARRGVIVNANHLQVWSVMSPGFKGWVAKMARSQLSFPSIRFPFSHSLSIFFPFLSFPFLPLVSLSTLRQIELGAWNTVTRSRLNHFREG